MDLKKINDILMDNDEWMKRSNSNKNTTLIWTSRCVATEEYVKQLTLESLPEDVRKAHEDWSIYVHDMWWWVMPFINCMNINLYDMLDNWTVMNWIKIESPKWFLTACNLTIQIIFWITSMCYWWKTIPIDALSKYLKLSEDKLREKIWDNEELVQKLLYDELKAWVQTMFYQTLTLISSQDWQGVFSTWYMALLDSDPYIKYTKMIIDEILRQKIKGMPNAYWIPHSTAMPKLVMLLSPNLKDKYRDTFDLALECISKRSMPDWISEKKMREYHHWNVFWPMWCRSFLSDRKDENGNWKYWWRFNKGVVSINLVRCALEAKETWQNFYDILRSKAELCYKAHIFRINVLKWTKAERAALLFMYGAISRKWADDTIDDLLEGWYSTTSLGYVGIHEALLVLLGKGIETDEWHKEALKIVKTLRWYCDERNERYNYGFSLYATPAETTVYHFNTKDRERYENVNGIFDHKYYTNSFHINVRTPIDAISKLEKEAEFQKISSWWCISFVECGDLSKNLKALEDLSWFMYETSQYAEFNFRNMDVCSTCWFVWELLIKNEKRCCPQCWETDLRKLVWTKRICWYLTTNLPNKGKMEELNERVYHI